uniref:Uncharacterized protein n=1 Tax=Kwoniella dejecticola CBS 10117 TaxID=1296121 RepID=A0A1A5ZVG5_9TREE|nr:uncharacterized protein I303_07711 [Kwoniella dejecticola CBS 10117]OBR81801.1 hypothetical protein I303_07711 [Kwoniella dejecticola CBS 10117]
MHQPDLLAQQQQSGPPPWAPYVSYPHGAVVWYAGTFWRCEDGHTSGYEPDGAPTNNLHLWTPVGSSGGYSAQPKQKYQQQPYSPQQSRPPYPQQHPQQGYNGHPPSYSPQPPSSAWGQQGYYNAPSGSSPGLFAPSPHRPYSPSDNHEKDDTPSSGETITDSKNEKERGFGKSGVSSATSFFTEKANESLRYMTIRKEVSDAKDKDELKHELKGKRVWRTGGIGIWSYSEDQKEEELKKKLWKDWSDDHDAQDWIKVAKERREFYDKESKGVKPLFMWKLVEKGQRLPNDALPIGREQDGAVLYAARAWWEGGIHLGKAGHHLISGASISYGGAEITLDTYEVLCGPINEPYLVKWMTYRHGEVAAVQGWQPIEGGREKDGTALLLAKGDYEK